LRNAFSEIAVKLRACGDNQPAVEGDVMVSPADDFAAGFLYQKQSGGDVPGVDEAMVVLLAAI